MEFLFVFVICEVLIDSVIFLYRVIKESFIEIDDMEKEFIFGSMI